MIGPNEKSREIPHRSIKKQKAIDHSKPKTILDFEEISLEETNRFLLKKLNFAREYFWNFIFCVKEDFSNYEIKVLNIVCNTCDNVLGNNEDFCENCKRPAIEKKTAENCSGKGKRKCVNCDNFIPSRATYCKYCKYDYKTGQILNELPVVKPVLSSKIKKKKKHVNIKINTVSDVSVLIENDKTLNNISLFRDLYRNKNKNLQTMFNESAKVAFACLVESEKELVELNFPLVKNIANKILNSKKGKIKHLKVEDLYQEGSLGLIKAIHKFDVNRTYAKDGEQKEIAFSTYATWWITKEILKCIIVKDKPIRLPDHIINKYKNFHLFYYDYLNKHLEPPSQEILTKELKLSKKNVEALLFAICQNDHIDFNAQMEAQDIDHDDNFLVDKFFLGFQNDSDLYTSSNILAIIDSIKFKKDFYKDAFIDMFSLGGKEYTLDEVSEKYEISKVTLIKIRDSTIDKLKKKINLEDW